MAKRKNRSGGQNQGPPREAPPIVNLDAEQVEDPDKPELPQIELFEYEGKKYFMAQPAANVMLKMLWTARTSGMVAAVGELLIELIGEDTYKVLMGIDDLEPEEMSALMNRVMFFATDRMEAVLGNF
jgi:hypothetical protein